MVAIKFLMMLILFACILNGNACVDRSWFRYHFDTKPIIKGNTNLRAVFIRYWVIFLFVCLLVSLFVFYLCFDFMHHEYDGRQSRD